MVNLLDGGSLWLKSPHTIPIRPNTRRLIAMFITTTTIVRRASRSSNSIESRAQLDGRAAITHHGALEDLRRTRALVIEARVVDDGDILTSGGVTSSIDLALWFVERQWGSEIANTISRSMEYGRSRDIYKAEPDSRLPATNR